MSSNREVRDLLDRAAEGPVGPAPIAELVGRGARRRRTWQVTGVGLTAAVTAAVIVIASGIAGNTTPTSHHAPTPSQTPISPAREGVTATRIAHGVWRNVPAPPIKSCGSQTVTSNGNLVILVVSGGSADCPNAAAVYDARTDNWTKLQPPPAPLRGQLTFSRLAAGRVMFVSRATTAAAVLTPRTGTWQSLPSVPASGSLATLVTGTTQPILIGAGAGHDLVFSLDGSRWISRPSLPHLGTDIVALAAYSNGETQWAFASEEHATHDGFRGSIALLRLTEQRWVKEPNHSGRPLVVRSIEPLGNQELMTGDNCLPGASCPVSDLQLGISNLDRGQLEEIAQSPLQVALTDAVVAEDSVVGLDTYSELGGGGPNQPKVRPLASAVYDIATGHWLPGPHGARINNISGMAWTPRGLVVLGNPAERCVCNLGGLILRPETSR